MNLDIYTVEMRKSIWDKAFFMDKIIGAKCIVDYGCADAQMICYLARLFPEIEFHGYDINIALIDHAVDWILFYELPNVHVWSPKRLPNMIKQVSNKFKPDEICLNFSSVLHEVFSSSPSGKDSIAYIIKKLHPKYITIRDMYYSGDNKNVRLTYVNKVINKLSIDKKYIEDFENFNGSIMTHKGFLQFLMKYQWKDNGWKDELEENYFSWTMDNLLNIIGDYNKVFEAYYLLPYYAEKWKEIDIQPMYDRTHAQFILRRDD